MLKRNKCGKWLQRMASLEFLERTKKVACYHPTAPFPPKSGKDSPPWEGGKFTKRPVEIEAHQWFKNGDHPNDKVEGSPDTPPPEGKIVRYYREPGVDGSRQCAYCYGIMKDHGWIDTMEGGHIVCPGDWIITGIEGEHYPCKNDIFHKTYDPV